MIGKQGATYPSRLHPKREGMVYCGRVCTWNSLLRTWKSIPVTDSWSQSGAFGEWAGEGSSKQRWKPLVRGETSHKGCVGLGSCLIGTLPPGCISCCAVCTSWFASCHVTEAGIIKDEDWFRQSKPKEWHFVYVCKPSFTFAPKTGQILSKKCPVQKFLSLIFWELILVRTLPQ